MVARIAFAIVSSVAFAAALPGCEADDSAPIRPRQPWMNADQDVLDRAKKREEEKPNRDLPAGDGTEFPGQSKINIHSPQVILAMGGIQKSDVSATPSAGPVRTWGTLPHLHTLDKTEYAVGKTTVPGIAYAADHSWGQVLPLKDVRHRNWPVTQAIYLDGTADHNPTYYRPLAAVYPNLLFFAIPDTTGFGSGTSHGPVYAAPIVTTPQPRKIFPDNSNLGSFNLAAPADYGNTTQYSGLATTGMQQVGVDQISLNQLGFSDTGLPATSHILARLGYEVLEAPWFAVQTIFLPVMMFRQVPWAHVQSSALIIDPLYAGYVPSTGSLAPTAYPGEIRWIYPWTGGYTNPTTMPDFTNDMIPKKNP